MWSPSQPSPKALPIARIVVLCLLLGPLPLLAQPGGTCSALTPGWGVEPAFASRASYWNPMANGVRDSTETNVDAGGTWLYEVGAPPNAVADAEAWSSAAFAIDDCDGNPITVTGSRLDLELNGLSYSCFFPEAAPDLVILVQPATTIGGMHSGPNPPPKVPVFEKYRACTYDPNPQGGHPLNTSVRAFWALGRYLKLHDHADRLLLNGGSLGSFQVGLTAVIGAGDPDFPVVGGLGYGGFEAERHLAVGALLGFTLGVNNPNHRDLPSLLAPVGDDPEMFRTFFYQHGAKGFADVSVINFADMLPAGFDLWIYMGDEDLTTHADRDAFDFGQALAGYPAQATVKVFATKFGGHTGDGWIEALYLGNGVDPYNGAPNVPLNMCRDLDLMITSQNLLTDPIPGWPALTTSGKTPLGRRFAEVLTPPMADVIGGTEPTLLTPGPRLGLGSQLGARDNLHADVDEDGSIRLVFGNFEGEVQRASVDAAGTMQIDWTRRVGYQAFALAQVDDDTMFFATDEGRAGLIDIPTGNLLTITAPGHVGTRPRRPIVGPAYDDNGVATELIFLTNSQLEILGLDPQTLDVVYRNATIGTFEDWAFTSPLAGNKRAWIALTRGHLVLVEFDLAGCVEVVAMTPPLNDLPKKILVAGEHAMVSDSQGTHVFDPQGNELPPPPGSYFFDTCLKVDEEGKVIPPRPDIMRIVPNTTWLLWQDGHCVGVTDLFEIDFENPGPPVAPLAKVENVHRMLSLAAAGGRYFATTPTQVLELVPVPSSTPGQFTIQKNPLNLPTGGTIAMSEDTATGDVMMIHLLEPPGAPPAGFDGSLLRVDPTNPGSPVIIEGSGYLYWDSSLAWHGGAAYLTWEGTLLAVAGQPVAFSPMSLPEPKERLEPDRTEGHFFAMPDFLPASDMGVTPPAFFAYPYGPGKLKNAKVTTNMPGIANRGASTVHRLGADGVYRVYVSTAGGRVFLFKVDAQTGLPLSGGEPDAESIDLGWKAVGLTTGVYQPVAGDRGQDQDVVFAGTWLSHQQLTGHVYVLDAETLDVIKVLGTGIGSLGIRQVDLEGDGLYELLVGTFASFQVWRAQGADFVQAWKGELGSMGYGAYNHIFVKENTAGQVEQIFTSTTGGLKVFDVTLPGTTAE